MPLLTYHPRFGVMFPSRAPRLSDTITSIDQATTALKRIYCEKSGTGKAVSAAELVSAAQVIYQDMKASGVSTMVAAAALVQLTSLAYDLVKNGAAAVCGSVPTPTPTAAPVGTGGGSGTALAIAAALVGGAALLSR